MADEVRDAIASMLAEFTALAPLVPTPTGDLGYGVDLVCVDDVDADLRDTDLNSTESLAQDNYHRVSTATGSLPDDLDYGIDLAAYLNKGTTVQNLQLAEGAIETELLKDDRNAEVSAVVLPSGSIPNALDIRIRCVPADPDLIPFSLILAVTSAATLLEAIEA